MRTIRPVQAALAMSWVLLCLMSGCSRRLMLEGRPCPCATGYECCLGQCVPSGTCPDGGTAAEAGTVPAPDTAETLPRDGAAGVGGPEDGPRPASDGPPGSADVPPMCPAQEGCAPGMGRCGGPACSITFATDHAHCGRCGRDCLDGECQGGDCQPATLLTLPRGFPAPPMGVNAKGVYWAKEGAISEYAFTTRATTPITTTDGEILEIAIDDAFAYFIQRGGACVMCIRRVALVAGATAQAPLGPMIGHASLDLSLNGNQLFWFDSLGAGSIRKMTVGMSASAMPQELAMNQGTPLALAVHGEHVYWASRKEADGSLKRVRWDGTSPFPEQLLGGLADTPDSIAVDDENIYWTERQGAKVRMAPKQVGAQATTLLTTPTGEALDILVHGTSVFWAHHSVTGGVHEYSRCTGQSRLRAAGDFVAWLALHGGQIYFSHNSVTAGFRRFTP